MSGGGGSSWSSYDGAIEEHWIRAGDGFDMKLHWVWQWYGTRCFGVWGTGKGLAGLGI